MRSKASTTELDCVGLVAISLLKAAPKQTNHEPLSTHSRHLRQPQFTQKESAKARRMMREQSTLCPALQRPPAAHSSTNHDKLDQMTNIMHRSSVVERYL